MGSAQRGGGRDRHEFAGGGAVGLLGEPVGVRGGGGWDQPFAKRMDLRMFQELPTAIPPAALGWPENPLLAVGGQEVAEPLDGIRQHP